MITDVSFTKEWINSLKMQNTKAYINPPLLEKMTYALSLAELLQLNFNQYPPLLKYPNINLAARSLAPESPRRPLSIL